VEEGGLEQESSAVVITIMQVMCNNGLIFITYALAICYDALMINWKKGKNT
jgi:hypothetical protein